MNWFPPLVDCRGGPRGWKIRMGRNNMLASLGVCCAAPAWYFVVGSVLKHELGLLGSVQIREFHPAVLAGGLALSLALNLWPSFKPDRMVHSPEEGLILLLKGRGLNAALAVISGVCIFYYNAKNPGGNGGGRGGVTRSRSTR